MGMDRVVQFRGSMPSWESVYALLQADGISVQMRMIDGQLAFPEDVPPPEWTELRVSLGQGGMVTVRREAHQVRVVTWGNADAATQQGWNRLTWAWAASGSGQVEVDGVPMEAGSFRDRVLGSSP